MSAPCVHGTFAVVGAANLYQFDTTDPGEFVHRLRPVTPPFELLPTRSEFTASVKVATSRTCARSARPYSSLKRVLSPPGPSRTFRMSLRGLDLRCTRPVLRGCVLHLAARVFLPRERVVPEAAAALQRRHLAPCTLRCDTPGGHMQSSPTSQHRSRPPTDPVWNGQST